MDTDWCLGCDRRLMTDGDAYCSSECRLFDQSPLARSFVTPPQYRPRFQIPLIHPHQLPSTTTTTTTTHSRTPCATFLQLGDNDNDDDEPQAPTTTAGGAAWQCNKDREGILQWVHSVHPGLEDDGSNATPCQTPPSPAMEELQKVLYGTPSTGPRRHKPFLLTAQNLAPPCVTVEVPQQLTTGHALSLQLEDFTSLGSQDDSSLLTPATESLHDGPPSFADAPPAKEQTVLFGRLVNRMREWVMTSNEPAPASAATPTTQQTRGRKFRASQEGNPSPPPEELLECLPNSDETLRQFARRREREWAGSARR